MSTDPRAARTRHLLVEAALGLSGSSGAQLSASSIARAAGVNRSSFYAHFDSVEALVCELLDTSLAGIAEHGRSARATADAPSDTAGRRDLRALVEHVEEHRHVYVTVLGTESGAVARAHLARVLQARFADSFERYGALAIVDPPTVQAAATGVGHAVAALLADWLLGTLECTEERLTDHLVATLPPWTRRLRTPDADTRSTSPIPGGHP